jgi:hypothetical protein
MEIVSRELMETQHTKLMQRNNPKRDIYLCGKWQTQPGWAWLCQQDLRAMLSGCLWRWTSEPTFPMVAASGSMLGAVPEHSETGSESSSHTETWVWMWNLHVLYGFFNGFSPILLRWYSDTRHFILTIFSAVQSCLWSFLSISQITWLLYFIAAASFTQT